MTELSKNNLITFGKVLALALVGFVAIITSAGVWNGLANGCVEAFYGWVAGLNLVGAGFGVWALYKKLFKKEEK